MAIKILVLEIVGSCCVTRELSPVLCDGLHGWHGVGVREGGSRVRE